MDHQSILISLLLSLFSATASGLKTENIAFGARVSSPTFHPYHVALYINGTYLCGGALIASDTVLTAAHCFFNGKMQLEYGLYQVRAGMIDNADVTAQTVNVSLVYLYRDYVHRSHIRYSYSHRNNDIAVLKLGESFVVAPGSAINTISLPSPGEEFYGKEAIVTGYGTIKIPNPHKLQPTDSDYIKTIDTSLNSLKYTVDLAGETCQDNGTFYCAKSKYNGALPTGACAGDSGGPLVVDNKVAGIVSYGDSDCNDVTTSGHFTKVTPYLYWIRDVVANRPTKKSRKIDIQNERKKRTNKYNVLFCS